MRQPWGIAERVRIGPIGPQGAPGFVVVLPKGSINPGNASAPKGGMGFRWRPARRRGTSACLTYALFLPPDFAFAQGGKLPGLFGGDAPVGGRRATGRNGFSTRLMWRRRGRGEVYAYLPGHPPRRGTNMGRGASLGRGAWRFPTGRWVHVAQRLDLNRPGRRDGRVRIWIDGRLRFDRGGLVVRTRAGLTIDGVMADVFYGGASPRWAAPRDTFIGFSPFVLHLVGRSGS
ncbi:MAG: polysaccharide lyase [Pseudomonadota bacterium]